MAGKPVLEEYNERIDFYAKLEKVRPLEEHEIERLDWLVRRVKDLPRERRYKEKNKEQIKQKQRDYLKTRKGKAKSRRNYRAAYERNPQKFSERGKAWRANNPEKYQAQQDRKNAKRREERERLRSIPKETAQISPCGGKANRLPSEGNGAIAPELEAVM